MSELSLRDRAAEAAAYVERQAGAAPALAVVLGSGLGAFADRLKNPVVIPYAEIPHFPMPTVSGHAGRLCVGTLSGTRVAAFQGRLHSYEGHGPDAVTFPMRLLQLWGVKTVVLTAATGGIRDDLAPGAIVCISDHINLLGNNPLRGPNDDRLGERFPDMSEVYSWSLRCLAAEAAAELAVELPEGVYAAVPGPSYETPAEVRLLKIVGADVVGMSTAPEAVAARHGGMEVLGFAVVANRAAGLSEEPLSHADVLEAMSGAATSLADLLELIASKLG